MRILPVTLLAGCAALALAARAADAPQSHVIDVTLPDGSVEQISYTGNIAPGVQILPQSAPVAQLVDPIAAFDQMAAQMDRQMDEMMQAAQAMTAQDMALANRPILAADGAQPVAGESYVQVSTLSPQGACTQTLHIDTGANGVQHVAQQTSGDCKGVPSLNVAAPATAQAQGLAPRPAIELRAAATPHSSNPL